MIYGINVTEGMLLSDAQLDKAFKDIAELGFTHVRVELIWQVVEKVKRKYDWKDADRVRNAAYRAGLKILWVVGVHEPKWGWFGLVDQTTVYDFGPFCAAIADKYGRDTTVHGFEIWNEPNSAGFFGKKNFLGQKQILDPKGYVAYLQEAYDEFAGLKPVTLGGIMACPSNPWVDNADSPEDWYKSLKANGMKQPFNFIGYHPYSYKWDEGPQSGPFLAPGTGVRYLNSILTLSEFDRPAWGDPIPVDGTEWGFDWSKPECVANAHGWLTDQWDLFDRLGQVKVMNSHYLYSYQDYAGFTYGLYDAKGIQRIPVYNTIKNLLAN